VKFFKDWAKAPEVGCYLSMDGAYVHGLGLAHPASIELKLIGGKVRRIVGETELAIFYKTRKFKNLMKSSYPSAFAAIVSVKLPSGSIKFV
jgi:methyl coenzyme M reductase subunit C-like uncharacterized protein (methanogenesis marker protein 7)